MTNDVGLPIVGIVFQLLACTSHASVCLTKLIRLQNNDTKCCLVRQIVKQIMQLLQ